MSQLNYKPNIEYLDEFDDGMSYEDIFLKSKEYKVYSMYEQSRIKKEFQNLKANIVDIDPAIVTKSIQGTEQDFIMLMNRAKEFLRLQKRTTDT